ncbi:hypothetical protein [Streptomyces lasiicapitis]|uniref:DUF3263 domain-containing protein n=1 Tax=Streptomyces lasiicapitis TaxID=1923961 RepID=A0ABQ2MMY3_9ACTN|nr:hypothetical protein [Streptomyces lasiicapitis]GGO54666.1 hypothetical protein GCM10012286_64970 [Streptomyces lasiicapitis]
MEPSIPDDLVRMQREWSATYAQLAQQPGHTALRRRLLKLSMALARHPLSPAKRAELRQRARSGGTGQ